MFLKYSARNARTTGWEKLIWKRESKWPEDHGGDFGSESMYVIYSCHSHPFSLLDMKIRYHQGTFFKRPIYPKFKKDWHQIFPR